MKFCVQGPQTLLSCSLQRFKAFIADFGQTAFRCQASRRQTFRHPWFHQRLVGTCCMAQRVDFPRQMVRNLHKGLDTYEKVAAHEVSKKRIELCLWSAVHSKSKKHVSLCVKSPIFEAAYFSTFGMGSARSIQCRYANAQSSQSLVLLSRM
jgi:hypothetical protein